MWLISPADFNGLVWYIFDNSSSNPSSAISFVGGATPSINLKSEIVITGGTGLEDSPYIIGLPS